MRRWSQPRQAEVMDLGVRRCGDKAGRFLATGTFRDISGHLSVGPWPLVGLRLAGIGGDGANICPAGPKPSRRGLDMVQRWASRSSVHDWHSLSMHGCPGAGQRGNVIAGRALAVILPAAPTRLSVRPPAPNLSFRSVARNLGMRGPAPLRVPQGRLRTNGAPPRACSPTRLSGESRNPESLK